MKIGLISDIHADSLSLLKALRIFKQVGVNKILCAGDLVDRGDNGDKVVALIRGLKIPCVLGNHDETAYENQLWIENNMDMSRRRTQNMLLKSETLDYLQQLPHTLRFKWGDTRLLLVHGSPTSNLEYLASRTHISDFINYATKSNADIMICGHTHHVMHYIVKGVHFINPGSVYKGVSSHTCGILTLPDTQLTIYHLGDDRVEVITPQLPS